ncbi:RiPP maturation radical SAM C-methyltransferase [Thiovibrio frasassiensis]|uniref:RiPP maturation radical SAM C-methyltransferase n=1 Tax=Thiovibrio frasassiensis TaxID=2984131 RepID=A0A9X4RM02_9BACT|nr:RiPP maturation radical SAM C-methyltransferase [Thiovibrio frasassiensis]MDG4476244.1 RiPP maturation radical SAM C-methyltransferase [Thiovibrio frasassiensis]
MAENTVKPRPPFRLGVISMPWALFNRPSIQLGALQGYLSQAEPEMQVACLHPYLGLTKSLGLELYREISQDVWLCEGLYAGLLFPEQRPVLRGFLAKRLKQCDSAGVNTIDILWAKVETHLHQWLAGQDWGQFELVGFSVCFNQLLASLLAAKQLKALQPQLPIVFGGSSCVAEMGSSLLEVFPWLDYVVHGEGEIPLANLCRVLAGREIALLPQVMARTGQTTGEPFVGCQLKGLSELPTPDYDGYFQELRREFSGEPFVPELPVEFSRGCWWGKCTFCNLNLQWHGYRGKSAEQMEREVLHLSGRHGCLDFSFTDNVLPGREAPDFFARMDASKKDFRFFAEIRVNQRGDILKQYRQGGLVAVQAGIESLSQGLLERMRKGATVMENLALMKESVALGIRLDGNLITGFPGSTETEVQETLMNLDFVLPFTPLTAASFFLGHGCEVACKPQDYGIRAIVQHPHNRKLFPSQMLQGLTLLINDYRGDRAKQRRLWQPVVEKIRAWQRFHAARRCPAHLVPLLSYRDAGNILIIRQELPDQATLHHRLRGTSRALYLACETIVEFEALARQFPKLGRAQLATFLTELTAKRLLFSQGTRYLALAVHTASGTEL